MGTVFHKKELLVLLQDFYCLTGLRAVVFDSFGMEVLSYPPELPAYCRLIRSVPNGKTGCYLCDQAACRKATRQKQTVIYPCHAGLIEVITPIQINDAVVGFLLLSHIVQGADEQGEWDYAQKCCGAYKVDADALREAYNALPRTPYPVLKSASDLLALAAAALYQKGLTRLAADSMQEKLSRYLAGHLHIVIPSWQTIAISSRDFCLQHWNFVQKIFPQNAPLRRAEGHGRVRKLAMVAKLIR